MNSKPYVVVDVEQEYTKVVRMTEDQARALNWLFDEFTLDYLCEPVEEHDCMDLSKPEDDYPPEDFVPLSCVQEWR